MNHEYRVSFVTPAFLGDAEQKGRWRTPPFKALLRHWWRIAAARECGYDHEKLREAEGRLFGHAWLKNNKNGNKTWAMRSRIRLRLDTWSEGDMKQWPRDPQVRHPEVKRRDQQRPGMDIGAHLYLGYGPLAYERGTALARVEKGGDTRPAIKAGDSARLRLIGDDPRLATVMQLIHWFGTIGGRAANGWGSIALEGDGLAPIDDLLAGRLAPLNGLSRPWTDCLDRDWPHAFGSDEQGLLLWKTGPHGDWSSAMQALAKVKIAFRTHEPLSFRRNRDESDPRPDRRHLLAYPITHHGVDGWVKKGLDGNFILDKQGYLIQEARFPNQIAFKVVQLGLENRHGYVGVVFHRPHSVPSPVLKKLRETCPDDAEWLVSQQRVVWPSIHDLLDENLARIGGAPS